MGSTYSRIVLKLFWSTSAEKDDRILIRENHGSVLYWNFVVATWTDGDFSIFMDDIPLPLEATNSKCYFTGGFYHGIIIPGRIDSDLRVLTSDGECREFCVDCRKGVWRFFLELQSTALLFSYHYFPIKFSYHIFLSYFLIEWNFILWKKN